MNPVKAPAIRPLSECPSHLDTVSKWIFDYWHDHSGLSAAETRSRLDNANSTDCPPTLIAEENGAPVGVLGFQRFVRSPGEPPSLFVDVLFVLESERGRGIGAALAREGIERARPFAQDLYVYTSQRDWYQKLGWTVLRVDPVSSLFVLSRAI